MNFIIVFLTILFMAIIGYVLIRAFELIEDNLFTIGCSFGLGAGLVSLELYLYSRLAVAWEKSLLILPWVILLTVIIFIKRRNFTLKFPKIPKLSKTVLVLLALVVSSVLYTCFEGIIRPATTWDSWANWLIESKIFFLDGKINPNVFIYLKSEYPLVFKLMGTFVYIVIGREDDSSVMLISSAFYSFLALSLFAMLRKQFGLGYSLLFTFFFVTIQNFVRHGGRLEAGQADLPIGYFAFISTMLAIDYIKHNRAKTLILLNILLGILSLIKFEGMIISVVIELCIFVQIFKKKKNYAHMISSLLWIVPYVEWLIFRKINNLGNYYFEGHGLEASLPKTISSLTGTVMEFFNLKTWNILWISYFYVLFRSTISKKVDFIVPNLIIISQIVFYTATYIFTAGNFPESSFERLLIHIAPLAIYFIAIKFSTVNFMKAR